MDKVIKLYTYSEDGNAKPFPSEEEQIEIFAFDYNANRMGGAPSISAKIKHRLCLDKLWSDKVYAAFNGEMYFLMNTPSSSKSNTDERYEHDAQFLSEREVLNHVYFLDVVSGGSQPEKNDSCFSTGAWDNYKPWLMASLWKMEGAKAKTLPQDDKPLSNSTKVQFMGDLKEFVSRLNNSLNKSNLPYNVAMDEGIVTEDKLISFQDKYIASALQEAFTQYGVPYYFVGRTIRFGYQESVVTTPLKYGSTEALMSVSKQNANYLVINRITGQGSSDNLPYYYPNPSDDREAIEAAGGKWITPSQNLMPPIYRQTKGVERFYNAVNGKYPTPEGGFYEFENLFSDRKQLEGKVDFPEIKPSIVGITNAKGQRIDQFIEFAYDETDDDSYDEKTNEYNHPYFFARMRKTDGQFGFNLFDQANEKQEMVVSMTSGVCGACQFSIGVGEKTNKNIVQVDAQGNLLRDEKGNVVRTGKPQDIQNDTSNNEVWIALKKDENTYPSYKPMPNATANLRPSASDKFVLLGITMPQAYIDAAEKKLEDSLIKHMYMNNKEKFNISIRFSRIYFAEHPEVLAVLNENSKILVEYDGQSYTLYVDDYSYRMDGGSPLPEIEVNLVDTLTIGKNSLQTALDSVKQDILSSIGGGDFLKQGLKYFLRKDISDTARGLIRFLSGAEFGNFIDGQDGTSIDTLGNIIAHQLVSHGYTNGALGSGFILKNDPKTGKSYMEVDELFVRVKAFFAELEIKKLSYAGGNWIFSPAGMTCSKVEEYPTYYRCFFVAKNQNAEIENEFRVNDLVRSQEFNIKEGTSKNVSNRYYWRKCVGVGSDYIDLSKNDCDPNVLKNDAPHEGDAMMALGNTSDETRQNAIVISAYGDNSPSITQHSGIKTYSLLGTQKIKISPKENLFTGKFFFSSSNKNIEEEIKGTNNKVDKAINDLAENISFTERLQNELNEAKNQIDSKITTWYLAPVPTLQNKPASDWTTEKLKEEHIGDLYYSGEGKAYRFQALNGIYSWQNITDKDIIKALDDAKKAQDTADGKRRVFIKVPTKGEAYDVGDLWVNATYGEYVNELLRCKQHKEKGEDFFISHWERASKYTGDESLNDFIKNTYEVAIGDIMKQLDGVIETWFGNGIPTLGNPPANAWVSIKDKEMHLGDLYYDNTTGIGYRFSKDGNIYKWLEVRDSGVADALAKAQKAQDTADGKRRVFVDTPFTPYDKGDLWASGVFLKRCVSSRQNGDYSSLDWDDATNYTGDENLNKFVDGVFNVKISDIYNQIDRKTETWFTNYDPSYAWNDENTRKAHVGDLWYDTSAKTLQRYSSYYQWDKIEDITAINAAAKAAEAKDTADGKRRVFVAQPSYDDVYDVGDLWANATYGVYKNELLRCKQHKDAKADFSITHWTKVADYTNDDNLNKFINDTFRNSMDDLQNQVDGKIDMYYQSANPWNAWENGTEKQHVGDLWYNTSTKELKRYSGTDGSNTWDIIEDAKAIAAAEAASKAQDTADGKRRVFVDTPKAPYQEGDLWVNATYGQYTNELLRCVNRVKKEEGEQFSIADWEKASKYTDDTKAQQAISDAANAYVKAQSASTDAQNAKNKLESWASDKVISPTEKQSLKDEIARIDADKNDINRSYTKYNLGVPVFFNNAYDSYRTQLVELTDAYTENIPIPSTFATNQKAFYDKRTSALQTIADAAKKYAEDVAQNSLDNSKTYTDTIFSGVDGKVEAAVVSVKKYTDEAVKGMATPESNLLENSAMRFNALPKTTNSGIVFSIDKAEKYQGYNSLKAVFNNYSSQYDVEWATYNPYHAGYEKYTIVFYAKANGSYVDLSTKLNYNEEIKSFRLTTDWKRYEVTYSPTSNWSAWVLWTNQPCIVNIAIPMLAKGDKGLVYKEAPQDIREEIDSRLEIVEGQVSLKAERSVVDSLGNTVKAQGSKIDANTQGIQLQSQRVETLDNEMNKQSSRIGLTENSIQLQAQKVDEINGQVSANTSALLELTPDKISLKVKDEVDKIKVSANNLLIGTNKGKNNWNFNTNDGVNYLDSVVERGVSSARFQVSRMGTRWNLFCYQCRDSYKLWRKNRKCVISFDIYSSVDFHMNVSITTHSSTEQIVYFGSANIQANKWNHIELKATLGGKDEWYKDNKWVIFNCSYSGTYIFQNLMMAEGNVSSEWSPSVEDYLATKDSLRSVGIDIDSKNVTVTAEHFFVQNRNGQTALDVFGYNNNGNPVVKAAYMDVDNFYAKNLSATYGTIGTFKVDTRGLYNVSENPTAYITVEKNGGKFFRVNTSNSSMCAIRMDADLNNAPEGTTALNVSAFGDKCVGIDVIAQAGRDTKAIESHGNVELIARDGESVTVQGLYLNVKEVSSNYNIQTNDDVLVFVNNGYNITVQLPTCKVGKILIIKTKTGNGVTFQNGFIIPNDATTGESNRMYSKYAACFYLIYIGNNHWIEKF